MRWIIKRDGIKSSLLGRSWSDGFDRLQSVIAMEPNSEDFLDGLWRRVEEREPIHIDLNGHTFTMEPL